MHSRPFCARVSATIALSCLTIGHVVAAQGASDVPDLAMYARIREEGTARARVMDYATELMDEIGPRLTGSPNLKHATAWALDRFKAMRLSNVRTESWGEFGFGWRQRQIWMRMIEPDIATFIAQPAPWSPATPGPIVADVVAVRGFTEEKEFERYRGKLRSKIVLYGQAPAPPEVVPIDKPLFERLDDKQLADEARAPVGGTGDKPESEEHEYARVAFAELSARFLAAEGVRALVVPSGNNATGGISGGTMWVDFNAGFRLFAYQKAHAVPIPLVIVTNEHYGRMKRLLDRNVPVKLELNVDTELTGDREEGFNLFGEIPGVDLHRRDEVVMVMAHLDSWAAGTGATDDGAGVVIAMEAMRILTAVGIRPRRTIRLALWTGEEQGLLGSLEYVKRHVAAIPRADTPDQLRVPEFMRRRTGPIVPKPDHTRISAVYNLDAGGGKVRGVRAGNAALVPVFQQWIAPLQDLGVMTVSARSYCAGDCRPFKEVGIPTPAFRQDPLDYETLTHHTNMDTYEHLIPEDLRQAAIVVATMVYNTAMRDEMLPRLP